jgi:Na+/phosphate symporter
MKTPKGALKAVAVVLCLCGAMVWFVSRTDAVEKTYEYEIRPETTVGAYRSDAVRMMDAYERLMDRYMSLVESNLNNLGADMRSVLKKVDSIDRKIDNLGTRLTRIEKALDIPQPKPRTKKTAEQKPKE